ILSFLGVTLPLRRGVHGSLAAAIGLGILVSALFLAVLQVGSALASAGLLPPALGVWSGIAMFSALGLHAWLKAPQ
ncbi:MAG: hypothetical protein D6722_29080, partial [Bacteroidetes bacterium]